MANCYSYVPKSRAQGVLATAKELQWASTTKEVKNAYLGAIATVIPAGGHGIYMLDPASLTPVDVAATVPDSLLQQYEDVGRRDDPVLQVALESLEPIDSNHLPKGYSWESSAVLSVLDKSGFYHSLEAPVIVDGEVLGTLNMTRKRDESPFTKQDLAVMKAIADQVGAAITRVRRYDKVARDAMLLADALDAQSQPIILTTIDGQLIFSNRMAGKFVPGSTESYINRVQPILNRALSDLREGTKRIVTAIEQHNIQDSDRVINQHRSGLVSVKAIRLKTQSDAVVAFLSHRDQDVVGLPESTAPLSPREREVADLVSRGLTTRQISELSYISENTVKQHLKRIFNKLGVNSRAELVNAVWKSSVSSRNGETSD